MKVLQTDFLGDPNIGLLAKASEKVCLAGFQVPEKLLKKIGSVVGVETLQISLANCELVGIFSAMNSNGILIPHIASDPEIKILKKFASEKGLTLSILNSKFTALGNLILCNDNGAVVSKNFEDKEKKIIGDCLDVEVEYGTVSGLNSIGSCGIATNKGCVLHRDASEEELDHFQKILGVDTDVGTANFGSPFLGSCAIANSRGIVVGQSTTGPEITRMMETLGLL